MEDNHEPGKAKDLEKGLSPPFNFFVSLLKKFVIFKIYCLLIFYAIYFDRIFSLPKPLPDPQNLPTYPLSCQ